MSAFDAYDKIQGNTQVNPISPTTDICPNTACKYWNLTACAFAECRYTVPEVVTIKIQRPCNVCGNPFTVDAVSANVICPTCVRNINLAISKMHDPGDDD